MSRKTTPRETIARELQGRHVLMIATTAFGIIIAANMTMLFAATGSFPGLVVKNSYIAGQGWNQRTQAQHDLGWTSEVLFQDGALTVTVTDAAGRAMRDLKLRGFVGRPGTDLHDLKLTFQRTRDGYRAFAALRPGIWQVTLETTNGPAFRKSAELFIPGDV